MNSREDIEKLLERFGDDWPTDSSIVERVMHQIESKPASASSRQPRRTMMKSVLAVAASFAVAATLWWGLAGGGNSLYAQVIAAAQKAQTLHTIRYVQPRNGDAPSKFGESWYERGVGFRDQQPGYIRIANKENLWTLAEDRKVAARSRSDGIEKATEPLFAEIDQLARQLQDDFTRHRKADRTIDGRACQAYLLTELDRYADSSLEAGERRVLVFLDEASRLVRVVHELRDGETWYAASFDDWAYDEPIDRALFQPDFGDEVKVVDADEVFDVFADLASAVHHEERDGLIYAIHRVERFENGGVLVVSSVRGTEDTLRKFPLTETPLRPGVSMTWGPATPRQGSPLGSGVYRIELAEVAHKGVHLSWWVLIPRGTPPNHFEVSPGRIKLTVGVSPRGDYAKAHHTDETGVVQPVKWDIELDVPGQDELPTLQEIAGSVYADALALDCVPLKWLYVGTRDEPETCETSDVSGAAFPKAVAQKVRSYKQADIALQLEGEPDRDSQKPNIPAGAGRTRMGFPYEPLVNDSTLQRIAKHRLLRILTLRGTGVTDDGLVHLGALSKLEKLDLAETKISDRGLEHLKGLLNLKKLDLTKTQVTEAGVKSLKQALPDVEIQW